MVCLMNKLYTKLLALLLLVSCGDSIDADRNDITLPIPVDEIELLAEIDFLPQESVPSEFTISFAAQLEIPQDLSVLRGNSGKGFASITADNRKFCYQGNAFTESQLGGDQYFLRFETEPFLQCVLGGVTSFDPVVVLDSGDTILFQIEDPGCSIDAGTCIFTRARAAIEILETFP